MEGTIQTNRELVKLLRMKHTDWTGPQIGQELGITRQRVNQILSEEHLPTCAVVPEEEVQEEKKIVSEIVEIDLARCLRKGLSLRKASPTAVSVETTVPFELVERAALLASMTVSEFLKAYWGVHYFNGGFDGVFIRFERRPDKSRKYA